MAIVKPIWILQSMGVIAVGAVQEETWLKILVCLCGVISLILSVTFATLIKHLQGHNDSQKALQDQLKELRSKVECEAMHESTVEIMTAKFENVGGKFESIDGKCDTLTQDLKAIKQLLQNQL